MLDGGPDPLRTDGERGGTATAGLQVDVPAVLHGLRLGHLLEPHTRSAGLKDCPGIKVVAGQPADLDRTKGLDVMTNLLQAHPDVNGVFAENDEMALGAIKALGPKAGKSVQVVGFDGTPDGPKAVGAGTLYASVAQQPSELGRIAVRNALRAAEGEKVEKMVKVPVKVVTQDNVAGFEG